MNDNFRASMLMVLTMAGFSVEDVFIKKIAVAVPVGEILALLGIGGTLVLGGWALISRQSLWSAGMLSGPVVTRNVTEMLAMMLGTTALVLLPLSLVSSIMQAAPILVTIGAALILREQVGWRRWSAILVGLTGVLMIVKPGANGFEPAVLLSVVSVCFLALRDLATRATPAAVTTLQLTFWGYLFTIPAGLILLWFMGDAVVWPDSTNWLMIGLVQVLGIAFYFTLIIALRIGESSVVVPFRYTRLIFAMILGVTVFGERPDALALWGVALVVAAGLYTLMREARMRRALRASPGVIRPV